MFGGLGTECPPSPRTRNYVSHFSSLPLGERAGATHSKNNERKKKKKHLKTLIIALINLDWKLSVRRTWALLSSVRRSDLPAVSVHTAKTTNTPFSK